MICIRLPGLSSIRPVPFPLGNITRSSFLDTVTCIFQDGNFPMNLTFEQQFSPNYSPSPAPTSTNTDPKAQEQLLWNQWDFTKEKDLPWQTKKQNWAKLQMKVLLPHLPLPFSLLGRNKNTPQENPNKQSHTTSLYSPASPRAITFMSFFHRKVPLARLKRQILCTFHESKNSQGWGAIIEMWLQLGGEGK